jgi:hypothetical protein
VTGGCVGAGDVTGGAVVGVVVGAVTVVLGGAVVAGAAVVDEVDVVVEVDSVVAGAMVVAIVGVDVVLFERAAAAMAASRMTITTGTAIFAHNGDDRTHPIRVVVSRASTLDNC